MDSDSDGYAGEFVICPTTTDTVYVIDTVIDTFAFPWDTIIDSGWKPAAFDTVWRKGDGVPDFQGASPPPSPASYTNEYGNSGLRVFADVSSIRIRWNGVLAENVKDVFSREYDFEGYRVYISRDERLSSFSMLASYDIEDYNRYTWDPNLGLFRLRESPFTLEELQAIHGDGDTTWYPLDYTSNRPLIDSGIVVDTLGDTSYVELIYFFEPQDYNRSILANDTVNGNTPIRKVYPEAPKPPALALDSIPDSVFSDYVTEDGFFKYYEYEYTIEKLLPTVPYWVNVTSFDYGSPKSGLASLETNPTILSINTYALPSVQEVEEQDLEVYVYPNPYRLDAGYQSAGFEGRGQLQEKGADYLRRIHFANLPAKCTIRIFSLDGDLVREIDHNYSPGHPMANHDTWDLITRNTQQVVSGLYYWSVEDDQGNNQIGKLVIIM